MKTKIETCTYLSVSLSEEDKKTLKKAKDIITDICTIADNNCGTTILPGNSDEILLSEILEALEEIDYFIEMVNERQVEIIPY